MVLHVRETIALGNVITRRKHEAGYRILKIFFFFICIVDLWKNS